MPSERTRADRAIKVLARHDTQSAFAWDQMLHSGEYEPEEISTNVLNELHYNAVSHGHTIEVDWMRG